MILRVLGSSSSGNGYLLRSERTGEVLILEAGIRFDKVKQALGFDLSHVAGCLVTHEHGDHAKYAADFAKAYIPLFTSPGTIEAAHLQNMPTVHPVASMKAFTLGEFEILPFPVQHDALQPYGYLIRHPECGTVLFATDTYYLRYRFPGLNNILIECNYDQKILSHNVEVGRIDHKRYERTVKSHMSFNTCRETLMANDLSKVNNIILVHLSADNSNAAEFISGIREATGKTVLAAAAGMEMSFNKTPY